MYITPPWRGFPSSTARQPSGWQQTPNGTSSESSRRDVPHADLSDTDTTPSVDIPSTENRVFAIYQILLGWKQYMNIIMKPSNFPTQGQPNPRKIMLKVVLGPLFPTANIFFVCCSKYFFVCWNWFYTGNRLQKPNPTKISANTLIDPYGGAIYTVVPGIRDYIPEQSGMRETTAVENKWLRRASATPSTKHPRLPGQEVFPNCTAGARMYDTHAARRYVNRSGGLLYRGLRRPHL